MTGIPAYVTSALRAVRPNGTTIRDDARTSTLIADLRAAGYAGAAYWIQQTDDWMYLRVMETANEEEGVQHGE